MRRAIGIACSALFAIAAFGGGARSEEITSVAPPATAPAAAWPSPRIAPAPLLPSPDDATHTRHFYSGLAYGSESLVHPLRLILNGGFGALQFDNRSNRLSRVRFRHGWDRLWQDLGSPIATIEERGWGRFLRAEVIPMKVSRENGQYWPNYTLHLIGGGMSHVMMREWFEQHGYRHSGIAAGTTIAAYHLLNEVVEAGSRNEASTDAIADLLIFDPAGVWLFSHEPVAAFFSRRLHLRDWSQQPAIDPATGAIENGGQNFSIKVDLPRSERWSFFYYFGNHGEAGLSYRTADGSAFSLGAGLKAASLIDLGRGVQTVDLIPSAGFFYDRNGSLMFSATTARNSRDGLRLNAYPGLVSVRGWTAGLFVLFGRNGDTVTGVHLRQIPLGLAGH